MTLTGIGETRAAAILAYREEHGSFSSIEEIMNVQGIKEATFAKIKDEIVVG
jgi:competence protein ComEA